MWYDILCRYGDLRPGSTNERIFTSFYVLFGIFLLSTAVAAISASIYAQYNKSVEERFARMASRMQEEKARLSLSSFDIEDQTQENFLLENISVNEHSKQQGHILSFLDMSEGNRITSGTNASESTSSFSIKDRILSKVEDITTTIGLSNEEQHQSDQKISDALQTLNLSMFDEDLQDMKKNIFRTFIWIICVMVVGWLSMIVIEEWNVGDAFYWSVVTITTVGFGDIVPNSDGGKVFTMFYGLVGCAILANGLNTLVAYPLTKKSKQSELRVMLQFGGKLTEETLQEILSHDLFERIPNLRYNEDSISRSEFILLLLSMMNKTYDKDLIIISSIFDVLDKNKVGSLSSQTLQLRK